ncbi:hypothetical protein C8035_v004398 [Colletotrichum spinosum]|uniref:Uncharacterized protein n=1 Tax=Colletotrichum spinosum TaxID=1347390 RepID=A0A4R8PRU0_9PEZI|nr:hypothetical protein C8035_v004398 [Colletotrichum spinosum]
MSAVSATTVPSATATPICSNLYNQPNQDRNCAMPYRSNNTDIMKKCCGDADVVSYYDNCGLYCIALGQSVADLRDCLFDEGAGWTDVFCRDNGNANASATATGNSAPDASASATVISGDGDDDNDGESSATGSASGGGSTASGNAAAGVRVPAAGVSTLGLTVGALLLSAVTFGALQI